MASKRDTQKSTVGQPKAPIQRPRSVIRKGLSESLPTFVKKSYFMLGEREREVLNQAFEKYRPDRTEPILIGGAKALKPAPQLIVGIYQDSNGNLHGFLLRNGRFTTIDVPAAFGSETQANGINPQGDIVGFYQDSSGKLHGFLLSRE